MGIQVDEMTQEHEEVTLEGFNLYSWVPVFLIAKKCFYYKESRKP